MNESLAVKYRPAVFTDLLGQDVITTILTKQLETNTFKNAYIFAGNSGSGKTTAARIFANELNKGIGLPIEIDGASNNGVDNVREIIKDATTRSLSGEYKVFIIDECHSLSTQAWQAFLKCIEEPPAFTVFIFCTTEIQKVPVTIRNRCMYFNFNKVDIGSIQARLDYICQQEHFTDYAEGIQFIAENCNGGMRDAITDLERVSNYSTAITLENTIKTLGGVSTAMMFTLMDSIIDGNQAEVVKVLTTLNKMGVEANHLLDKFLGFCLDLQKYNIFGDTSMLHFHLSLESLNRLTKFENSNKYYSYILNKLLNIKVNIKTDINAYTTMEVEFLNLCQCL